MTTGTIRRKQVRDLTFKLLTEHGLTSWKVRFSNRMTRALGQCAHYSKTISYQQRYIEQNDWAEIENTIRHEVAHAIAGANAGHGAAWQRVAIQLGANPRSTSTGAKLTRKFKGTCPTCGREIHRDRRTGISCGKCSATYDPRHVFVWTRNA